MHKAVQEAAVIGVPDAKWGERPLAIVALREDYRGKISADDMKQHLSQYVEEGKITDWAIPEEYSFVDELPKTSVGKLDKMMLRKQSGAV